MVQSVREITPPSPATASQQGWTTVQRKKRAPQAPTKPTISPPDIRRFELNRSHGAPAPVGMRVTDIQSAINRALHRGGVANVSVEELRVTSGERLLGGTTHTRSLDALVGHRDQILKAARSVSPGMITDLVARQT